MDEFECGVRAGIQEYMLYFLNENEQPIYDISSDDLESFAKDAIAGALYDRELHLRVLASETDPG